MSRTLTGLSLGYFMVLFDTTALTVALPDVARDLGSGTDGLAWITDAYTLTFAGCLLAAGVIADRRGAGWTFRAGLAGFAALSLACAAAPATGWLIALRALLGVAGALLLPASLSLIAALHQDPARRAKAIAAWASISGAALAAGPLLGGALVAGFGWRAIFLVNAPVAAASALLLRGTTPAGPRHGARIAAGGQVAVFVAVAAFTWALIGGGAAPVVLAVLAVAAAVRAERAVPTIPAALLHSRLFLGALAGGLVAGGVFAGELFATTLELQRERGLGPVLTGVAFLPLTVPMMLNPPFAGRLIARAGPRRPVLAGLALVALGAALLATGAAYPWIALGLVLLGLGMSFTLPALTSAAVLAAPPEATGAAGGLFSVVRQTGAALGVAVAANGHTVLAVAAFAAALASLKGSAPLRARRA